MDGYCIAGLSQESDTRALQHPNTPFVAHGLVRMCLRYRYMIGALNSRLSSKSRMPPMPGNSLPESLTPASRLKSDSIKSPSTALTLRTTPRTIECCQVMPNILCPRKCTNSQLARVENRMAPPKPSHVLPGLMRGIIL